MIKFRYKRKEMRKDSPTVFGCSTKKTPTKGGVILEQKFGQGETLETFSDISNKNINNSIDRISGQIDGESKTANLLPQEGILNETSKHGQNPDVMQAVNAVHCSAKLNSAIAISIANSTIQTLQQPQHCQMVSLHLTKRAISGGGEGGTLPRSTPRKLIDPLRDGNKSATLTRQNNVVNHGCKANSSKQNIQTTLETSSYVSSRATGLRSNITQHFPQMTNLEANFSNSNSERDRCINAVIVS